MQLSTNINAYVGSKSSASKFRDEWARLVRLKCHGDSIWKSAFALALFDVAAPKIVRFQMAAVWAVNMVAGSFRFPAYVAALASRANTDIVRHALLENAWDESGGVQHESRSHYWLSIRLAQLLKLSNAQISRIVPLDSAKQYMEEHFQNCVQADFEFGLGMICLIEEFTTPEFSLIFRAMLETCEEGLGITPGEFVLNGGAEYFTANISDDERHREEMPLIVASSLEGRGVDLDDSLMIVKELWQVAAGMEASIRLRDRFFQEIYDFVQTGGRYQDLVAPE